jgi:hypothetical protein
VGRFLVRFTFFGALLGTLISVILQSTAARSEYLSDISSTLGASTFFTGTYFFALPAAFVTGVVLSILSRRLPLLTSNPSKAPILALLTGALVTDLFARHPFGLGLNESWPFVVGAGLAAAVMIKMWPYPRGVMPSNKSLERSRER